MRYGASLVNETLEGLVDETSLGPNLKEGRREGWPLVVHCRSLTALLRVPERSLICTPPTAW